MSGAMLYGFCSTVLVGLGLYGLIVHPELLRKILAFNLVGGIPALRCYCPQRRGNRVWR